jgi:predicted dienelactone hydrolase
MRLFEMLLLLSNIGMLVLIVFLKASNRRVPLALVSGISTLFLVAHLVVEGYRIQLLILYCITVIILIVSAYAYFRTPMPRISSRLWTTLGHTSIAVMLVITAGLMYFFPVFKLPEPTGNYEVGTQTFHFIDPNRDEIFDELSEGKRELMIQVWYPAQNTKGNPIPFIPDSPMLKEEPLSKALGLPAVVTEYLKYISSHSYEEAEISTVSRSYPLVILNHGYKSSRVYHTTQAENLASHGYIVASIDHTYSTFATVFPDGQTATMKTDEYLIGETDYRDKVGKVWTDDVTFTIDQFERINSGQIQSIFKEKLDLDHIGIFGHSFGGASAYDASYDDRITVGINLDGGLYRYHDSVGITKPFMFMYSESTFQRFNKVIQKYVYTDEELQAMGATREEIDQETRDNEIEVEHIKKVANNGGQVVYIEDTEHYNFADVQFLTPILKQIGMMGKIKPRRASYIINAYTLDFFDKYLKNKGGDLLVGPNNEYPEVKFATPQFAGETK